MKYTGKFSEGVDNQLTTRNDFDSTPVSRVNMKVSKAMKGYNRKEKFKPNYYDID